jgi:uncharacterized protein YjbI with pentapeptide repeats
MLAGAQLQDTDFRGADLRGVCCRQADARGAIFDGVNVSNADFTGALLQGARFRQCCLHEVSFRQALLLSAHLEGAAVDTADFTGANLEWAWIDGVDFRRAVVTSALFLNVRGLAEDSRLAIEQRGGFTGRRPMILGRELYETSWAGDAAMPSSEAG